MPPSFSLAPEGHIPTAPAAAPEASIAAETRAAIEETVANVPVDTPVEAPRIVRPVAAEQPAVTPETPVTGEDAPASTVIRRPTPEEHAEQIRTAEVTSQAEDPQEVAHEPSASAELLAAGKVLAGLQKQQDKLNDRVAQLEARPAPSPPPLPDDIVELIREADAFRAQLAAMDPVLESLKESMATMRAAMVLSDELNDRIKETLSSPAAQEIIDERIARNFEGIEINLVPPAMRSAQEPPQEPTAPA